MRCGREATGRATVSVCFLASVMVSGTAGAANIDVHATRGCADGADIAGQVDALLGRPVAAVRGLDFAVDIAEGPSHRWRLRLTTIERGDGARRSREIDGRDCAQLADAAAVAIAMSIQSVQTSAAAEPMKQDPPVATGPPPPNLAAAPAPPPGLRVPISVAALVDVGALPHPGVGLTLGAALSRPHLLIIGQGAFLLSPEARVADGGGGRFRMFVGALLACLDHSFGRTGLLACAGGEAGILQAEGIGINRPRSQNVGWQAALLEMGLTRRLNDTVTLFIRAGVAVPWSRPTFTINNEALAVHRPDVVTLRTVAGASFDLF